jgi:hypothetical protein
VARWGAWLLQLTGDGCTPSGAFITAVRGRSCRRADLSVELCLIAQRTGSRCVD